MPKLTLLDMTQRVLSSMDADSVNSYAETIESEQVAFIIRDAYYDLINDIEIPEHRKLIALTALGDTAKPTTMLIPNGIHRIEEVRYNKIKSGDTDNEYDFIS